MERRQFLFLCAAPAAALIRCVRIDPRVEAALAIYGLSPVAAAMPAARDLREYLEAAIEFHRRSATFDVVISKILERPPNLNSTARASEYTQ